MRNRHKAIKASETMPLLQQAVNNSIPMYILTKLPDAYICYTTNNIDFGSNTQPLSITCDDSTGVYTIITKHHDKTANYICLKLEMPNRDFCPPVSKLMSVFARHNLPTLHVSTMYADYILFKWSQYKHFKKIIKQYREPDVQ